MSGDEGSTTLLPKVLSSHRLHKVKISADCQVACRDEPRFREDALFASHDGFRKGIVRVSIHNLPTGLADNASVVSPQALGALSSHSSSLEVDGTEVPKMMLSRGVRAAARSCVRKTTRQPRRYNSHSTGHEETASHVAGGSGNEPMGVSSTPSLRNTAFVDGLDRKDSISLSPSSHYPWSFIPLRPPPISRSSPA